jgi:hypothetical protein
MRFLALTGAYTVSLSASVSVNSITINDSSAALRIENAGGVMNQTITLEPTDSNAGGFSETLAAQTLTVTGTVEPLPPPVITASDTLSALAGASMQLGTPSIGDPNTDTLPLTVTVSDTSGALRASQRGAGTVSGSGSTILTLTGGVPDLNAELAILAYTAAAAGTDMINIAVEDQHHAAAQQSVPVNSLPVPYTAPVINPPAYGLVTAGQASGIGNLSVTDPYAVATGQTITITGTVPQINADLADGSEATFLETLAGGGRRHRRHPRSGCRGGGRVRPHRQRR